MRASTVGSYGVGVPTLERSTVEIAELVKCTKAHWAKKLKKNCFEIVNSLCLRRDSNKLNLHGAFRRTLSIFHGRIVLSRFLESELESVECVCVTEAYY